MAVATQHKEAGFTLVEILCVLAVLGLTAGLVVLNLPKGEDPMRTEVKRFAAQLNKVAQDSIIDGRVRALDVGAVGYTLYERDGDWNEVASQNWTEVRGVKLSVEDQAIDLKKRSKGKETPPPLIHFEPTGGVTPFMLDLSGRQLSFIMKPDARGRIVVEATR